jgi:hypothetical protein
MARKKRKKRSVAAPAIPVCRGSAAEAVMLLQAGDAGLSVCASLGLGLLTITATSRQATRPASLLEMPGVWKNYR